MAPSELYRLRTKGKQYISQQKLAKLSGYTQVYISMIETGRVTPSKRCWAALNQAINNFPSS